MERPMASLRQHQMEVAIAVQIAQTGVSRSFSRLLKLDSMRKLPSRDGIWNRGETYRDSAKNQNVADFQHQFLLKHRWKLEPFLRKPGSVTAVINDPRIIRVPSANHANPR